MTQAALEALKNSLLASGQPITAAIHRTWGQKIIDELYDGQSRGDVLSTVTQVVSLNSVDYVLVIRSGVAKLVPQSVFTVANFVLFTTATSTTAYTGTPSPALTGYANGQKFQIKAHATSTGAVTLNVSGLGAKKWFMDPTTQATTNDIVINTTYFVVYDSSLDTGAGGFLMVSGSGGGGVSVWGGITGTITDQTDLVSYVAAQIAAGVAGLLDLRGAYDASVNAYPSSGGSGVAGAILKADTWIISVAGTLPTGQAVSVGDVIFAIIDTPGNTQANWGRIEMNLVAWTTSAAGIVELSTQAEAQAIATRAAAGSASGQSDARTPSEIGLVDMLIQLFNTAVTWVAKMTFTAAPRFNSVTASQHLAVDSSKDLVSYPSATQAVMITGTNDTDPATAKSVEDKRSIKLKSFSNAATGSSTIDCLSAQEVTVFYNTTVTGAITIALSNDSNLEILNVIVPITGAGIGVTTPSTTRMARYNEVAAGDGWYQSTKIMQVSSVGTADTHEFSFKRASAGPTFNLQYDGPYRA